ncbi:uncharacterized protein DEA37_0012881 [Paragonimus westermani]|uniref:Uncharacterized protein n=1 Tax=Paragonimus westermani TaxID=34504 RepID=A0A5J4NLI6_9TREM|nr:uncharacterized protein DEA37_0012881 [Paragonimus westermani]
MSKFGLSHIMQYIPSILYLFVSFLSLRPIWLWQLWTVIILFLSRKAFRIPHRFTLCHLVCVLLSCLGVVAGHFLNQQNDTIDLAAWRDHVMMRPADWLHYIQFCLFFIGCTGARFWTTLIAFSLFIQRYRGVCYVLRHQAWIYLTGFSIPVFVTSVLLLTSTRQRIKDVDPAFQYGRGQLIVSLVVLILNIMFTLIFAIWYIRLGSSDQESQGIPQIEGICLCTWRLVQEAPSGVYLVLEFLDGTFNFGQGVVLFILFGLDADLIIFPIKRIVSRYMRKFLGVVLEATKLNVMTTTLSETGNAEQKVHQFVTYHLKTCADSIGKMTSSGTESVRVFSADALKRWLILSGLVHNQLDATNYVAALKSAHIVQEFGAEELTELSMDSGLVNSNQCHLFFTPSASELRQAE